MNRRQWFRSLVGGVVAGAVAPAVIETEATRASVLTIGPPRDPTGRVQVEMCDVIIESWGDDPDRLMAAFTERLTEASDKRLRPYSPLETGV